MSAKSETKVNHVTLRQLLSFEPRDDEKELWNINQNILDEMKKSLEEKIYYLGGQIYMRYDDILTLTSFDKVREINESRGGPCNSWEMMSVNRHKYLLEETEKIVNQYFMIMNKREI